jgi:hypothetical protein
MIIGTDLQNSQEVFKFWYDENYDIFKLKVLFNLGVQVAFPDLVVIASPTSTPTTTTTTVAPTTTTTTPAPTTTTTTTVAATISINSVAPGATGVTVNFTFSPGSGTVITNGIGLYWALSGETDPLQALDGGTFDGLTGGTYDLYSADALGVSSALTTATDYVVWMYVETTENSPTGLFSAPFWFTTI